MTGYDYNSRVHATEGEATGANEGVTPTATPGGAMTAAEQADRAGIPLRSGNRTYEEQKALHDKWEAGGRKGVEPAKPGTSKHETGNAIDVDLSKMTDTQRDWLRNNGYRATIPSEPWHYERTGAPATAAKPEVTEAQRTNTNIAQQIANYQAQPLKGAGLGGRNAAIMAEVARINPDYNATKYETAQAMRKEYTKATPQSAGGQLNSVNRAIPHMDEYADAAKKLGNGDVNFWNAFKNRAKSETGNVYASDVDALKGAVAAEVGKAIRGGMGGVEERLAFEKEFDAARKSPEQLKSVIDKYQRLIAEQAAGLKQQWTSNGLPVDEFNSKLIPRTKEVLESAERASKNKRSTW